MTRLTNGFLPIAPFEHLEPTALGAVEAADGLRVMMMPPPRDAPRDALLLVRLHGEPLGLVHVPNAADCTRPETVSKLVNEELGERLAEHEHRFGCAREGADCPAASPPPLPGSVAIIIPTGGRVEQLDRCLDSLTPSVPADADIIIVDNRPASGQTRRLIDDWHERDGRIRYVAEDRPGSSVARNRGIAETDAEFLAFTDDDVVVDNGWLAWLLAPFADPKVNASTGLVLPLELSTGAQKHFEQYAGFSKGVERRSYDLGANSARDRLLYPYWGGVFGSGNSMAFRRRDLVAAGGFDPALGAGSLALAGADIEAMSAAILRGGRLIYEPRSVCWHEHRRDETALRRQLFNYGAGFTAILTKALTNDRRFTSAIVRSVPVALRLRRRRATNGDAVAATLPEELAELQRRGMRKGPLLYARSVRWAKQLRLSEVISGA
ncbi:MAG: glycosyltransferase [Solirubrobacteraceae bacterium]